MEKISSSMNEMAYHLSLSYLKSTGNIVRGSEWIYDQDDKVKAWFDQRFVARCAFLSQLNELGLNAAFGKNGLEFGCTPYDSIVANTESTYDGKDIEACVITRFADLFTSDEARPENFVERNLSGVLTADGGKPYIDGYGELLPVKNFNTFITCNPLFKEQFDVLQAIHDTGNGLILAGAYGNISDLDIQEKFIMMDSLISGIRKHLGEDTIICNLSYYGDIFSYVVSSKGIARSRGKNSKHNQNILVKHDR